MGSLARRVALWIGGVTVVWTAGSPAHPAPPSRPAPRQVLGDLIDFKSAEESGSSTSEPATGGYVDLLVPDGGPRRVRIPIADSCRFRSFTADNGRIVPVTDPDLLRPEPIGAFFRTQSVRITLNARNQAEDLETHPWLYRGILLSAANGTLTLRGAAEPTGTALAEEWSEWRADNYPATLKPVQVRLTPATHCTVNLEPVAQPALAAHKGRFVRVVPDALRRARYVDVIRFNGIATFLGGTFEQYTTTDMAGVLSLKKDSAGRFLMPVTAEGSEQVKGIWTSPGARHHDRRGFPVRYHGGVPDGATAAVWVEPGSSSITHVFW